MKYSIAVALLLVAAFSASAKDRKISVSELRQAGYAGVHTHVDHNERLDYQLGASSLPLGVLGQVLKATDAAQQGHALREAYGLDDPAVQIASNLGAALGGTLGLPVASSRNSEFKSVFKANSGLQDAKEIATIASPDDLVVHVSSNAWRVYKHGKDRYFVLYSVLAQLVDASEAKVLWKGDCLFPKPVPKKGESPLAATALEDGAASLKAEFAKATAACTDRLLAQMTEEPLAPVVAGSTASQ